jgi:hypothetical protein
MDFTRAEEKEHLERGAVGCKTRQHYKLKNEGILLVSIGVYGAARCTILQGATVYEEAKANKLGFYFTTCLLFHIQVFITLSFFVALPI